MLNCHSFHFHLLKFDSLQSGVDESAWSRSHETGALDVIV